MRDSFFLSDRKKRTHITARLNFQHCLINLIDILVFKRLPRNHIDYEGGTVSVSCIESCNVEKAKDSFAKFVTKLVKPWGFSHKIVCCCHFNRRGEI